MGIQYTFNGLALAKATVEQEHPTLQGAITNVGNGAGIRYGEIDRGTNLVTAEEADVTAKGQRLAIIN